MGPAVRFVWLALLLGWMHCAPAQQALYRLPYPEGRAFMISQAPGGIITTHTTKESRHAVDLSMPEGTPVVAAREGIVIAAEWRYDSGARSGALRTKGNIVRVRHTDGSIGNYAHFMHAGVAVEVGESVQAGRILGYSGSTGFSSGPHLHFAVTREVRSGNALEEVSVPVTFYIGNPPVAFAPRVGLAVTAGYASPAEPPAFPRAAPRQAWAAGFAPTPEVLAGSLGRLAALCALALLGLGWFYRFSRS